MPATASSVMMPKPPCRRSHWRAGNGLTMSKRRNSRKPDEHADPGDGDEQQRQQLPDHFVEHHVAGIRAAVVGLGHRSGPASRGEQRDDDGHFERRRPDPPEQRVERERGGGPRRARGNREVADVAEVARITARRVFIGCTVDAGSRRHSGRRRGRGACRRSGCPHDPRVGQPIVHAAPGAVEGRREQAEAGGRSADEEARRRAAARVPTDSRPSLPDTTLRPHAILPIVCPLAAVNSAR